MIKTCTICKKEKPYGAFYNSKATKDGKSYRCKDCDSVARKDYHKKHYHSVREKHRVNSRKSLYGLSNEQFEGLLLSQDGKCKICCVTLDQSFGRHHKPNKLVIDHCHITGEVRGLLCTMCNKGIGLLQDDPETVMSAFRYLTDASIH